MITANRFNSLSIFLLCIFLLSIFLLQTGTQQAFGQVTPIRTWNFNNAADRDAWSLNTTDNDAVGNNNCHYFRFSNSYQGGTFDNGLASGTIIDLSANNCGPSNSWYLGFMNVWAAESNSPLIRVPSQLWGSAGTSAGCPGNGPYKYFSRVTDPVALPGGAGAKTVVVSMDIISGACTINHQGGLNSPRLMYSFDGTNWNQVSEAGGPNCTGSGYMGQSNGSSTSEATSWTCGTSYYVDATGQSEIYIGIQFIYESQEGNPTPPCTQRQLAVNNIAVAVDQISGGESQAMAVTSVTNPVCGNNATVEFASSYTGCPHTIEVLDDGGAVVATQGNQTAPTGTLSSTVNVSALPAGSYTVRITHPSAPAPSAAMSFAKIEAGAALTCSTDPSTQATMNQDIEFTVDFPGLGAGNYTLTLTGSDGLSQTANVTELPHTFTGSYPSGGTKNYSVSISGTACPIDPCSGTIEVISKGITATDLDVEANCDPATAQAVEVTFETINFAGGENIRVELSAANGEFTTPAASTDATAVASPGPQTVTLNVPAGLTESTNYRIRVREIGGDNVISNRLDFIVGNNITCLGNQTGELGEPFAFSVPAANAARVISYDLNTGGLDNQPANIENAAVNQNTPFTVNVTFGDPDADPTNTHVFNYSVVLEDANGCQRTCTGTITMIADLNQEIDITNLSANFVCNDAGGDIDVTFTYEDFADGEDYLVQLSDADGNFGTPAVSITHTAPTSPSTATLTIPDGLATGTGYRVRVTNPAGDVISNLMPFTMGPVVDCPTLPANAVFEQDYSLANVTGTVVSWDFNTAGVANQTGLSGVGGVPANITFTQPAGMDPEETQVFAYSIVLRDANDCERTCTGTITASNTVISDVSLNDQTYCDNESIEVLFSTTGSFNDNNQFNIEILDDATGDVVFTASDVESPATVSISAAGLQAGNLYRVRILATDPSVSNTSDSITIIEQPVANFEMFSADEPTTPTTTFNRNEASLAIVALMTNTSTGAENCRWEIMGDNNASTIVCEECDPLLCNIFPLMYEDDDNLVNYTATLTVSDATDRCTDTRTVSFRINSAVSNLPNIFTPNGDGHNDFWGVEPGTYSEFELQVYNRYGEIVWSSSAAANNMWDGRGNGNQNVPAGTYVYRLKATDLMGRKIERSGTVTLLR